MRKFVQKGNRLLYSVYVNINSITIKEFEHGEIWKQTLWLAKFSSQKVDDVTSSKLMMNVIKRDQGKVYIEGEKVSN